MHHASYRVLNNAETNNAEQREQREQRGEQRTREQRGTEQRGEQRGTPTISPAQSTPRGALSTLSLVQRGMSLNSPPRFQRGVSLAGGK